MMPVFQQRISKSPLQGMFAAAWFALALLVPMHVEAQQSFEPREVYMLPVYCKYTQEFRVHVRGGNNPAEIDRWSRLMGGTFIHMHHYCYGLMAANRAAFISNTPQDRTHNLGISLREFDYVIQRAPPDFSMLPEILTKKSESLIRLGREGEAILDLQHAMRIKPDYWQAYAAMSDYYKGIGQLAKAREWLEKGLSVAPNAKSLVQRLEKLDGPKDKRKTTAGPGRKAAAPPPSE